MEFCSSPNCCSAILGAAAGGAVDLNKVKNGTAIARSEMAQGASLAERENSFFAHAHSVGAHHLCRTSTMLFRNQ